MKLQFTNLTSNLNRKINATYFFFRRGGNEPSEGAYMKYVTKPRRHFQRSIKKKDKPLNFKDRAGRRSCLRRHSPQLRPSSPDTPRSCDRPCGRRSFYLSCSRNVPQRPKSPYIRLGTHRRSGYSRPRPLPRKYPSAPLFALARRSYASQA